jgi:hypothetical protein
MRDVGVTLHARLEQARDNGVSTKVADAIGQAL